MKKLFYMLILMVFISGCESITLKGRHGSITINESSSYKRGKANGRALEHKKHKKHTNLYYNIKVSSDVYVDF